MGRRVESAIQRNKRIERKKKLKKVVTVLVVVALASIPILYKISYEYKHSLGHKVIDWNKVNYNLITEEDESVPGIVTQESYYKVRAADSIKTIQKIEGIIPEKFTKNLIDGLESNYYKEVTYSEYYDTNKEIRGLMAQSEYIIKMYDSYSSNEGFKDIDYCNTPDCSLKQFILSYTGNELREYLLDVHQKWESLVAYYATTVEVDDETINMFYEEELVTNVDYIESIEVRVYTLNSKLSNMKDSKLIEKLRETDDIPYKDLTIKDKEGLEVLSLYRSNKFYESNISALVPNTMISITGGNTNDSVVRLTGEKNIEDAIRNIEAPVAKSEGSNIKDLPYITFSLTEQSEDDVITVYYDIKSIKHIKELPTIEELSKELEKQARVYIAENSLAESLDTMITEDVGESREVSNGDTGDDGDTGDTENHDHDGNGVQDHIYKEGDDEWWILDEGGEYVPQIDEGHDHDGDGVADH